MGCGMSFRTRPDGAEPGLYTRDLEPMTDAIERLHAALKDRYTIERELGAGGSSSSLPSPPLRGEEGEEEQ